MATPLLTAENAVIRTASVEIKTLTVAGRQVTQSLFKQLREGILLDQGTAKLHGVPWGHVNYHVDCPYSPEGGEHLHVVWQDGDQLRRSAVPKNRYWGAVKATAARQARKDVLHKIAYRLAAVHLIDDAWPNGGGANVEITTPNGDVLSFGLEFMDETRGHLPYQARCLLNPITVQRERSIVHTGIEVSKKTIFESWSEYSARQKAEWRDETDEEWAEAREKAIEVARAERDEARKIVRAWLARAPLMDRPWTSDRYLALFQDELATLYEHDVEERRVAIAYAHAYAGLAEMDQLFIAT